MLPSLDASVGLIRALAIEVGPVTLLGFQFLLHHIGDEAGVIVEIPFILGIIEDVDDLGEGLIGKHLSKLRGGDPKGLLQRELLVGVDDQAVLGTALEINDLRGHDYLLTFGVIP